MQRAGVSQAVVRQEAVDRADVQFPAAASVGQLRGLLGELELATSLSELGIPDSNLERIVDASMECPDTYVNSRVPSRTRSETYL